MLTASQAAIDELQQNYSISATPRVRAEWNQNRYASITTIDNFNHAEATYGYDLDRFPIETIAYPNRPTRGILIGKTGEGITTSSYGDDPGFYRTYVADPDAAYKYWTSPETSGTTSAGNMYAINNCAPYIIYGEDVFTNKIYICFENSWATPTEFTVETTVDGTTWQNVASNIAPNESGQVILYLQDDGTWTTTENLKNYTQMRGIRLTITSLDTASSYLNLIELGYRLEQDLSDLTEDYSVSIDMGSDVSEVAPIGIASSNTGDITLSNVDGRFNNESPGPVDSYPWYRNRIDRNVKFTIDLGIEVNGSFEYIRQGTMLADSWAVDDATAKVSLKDASVILQSIKPSQTLFLDVTIGEAIWRLLDSVGFNEYAYDKVAEQSVSRIPYYWTNSSNTVWQHIQDICKTTQTAVYFDAYGTLRIVTREKAFDKSRAVDWTLDYKERGSKIADIQGLTIANQYEANSVIINYKPTDLAVDDQGNPISEVIWQPDGDVLLRSTGLVFDMTADQMTFVIDRVPANTWPYTGMVNIRGELIKFNGKLYRYIDKNGNWTYGRIYSDDDKKSFDAQYPDRAWMNYCTGLIYVTERGVDYTTATEHQVGIQQWKNVGGFYGPYSGTQTKWTGGISLVMKDSVLRLSGRSSAGTPEIYTAPRGNNIDIVWRYLGTRFRFPSNPKGREQIGGLFFNASDDLNEGFYVEIISTPRLNNPRRNTMNEVRVMRRSGGKFESVVGKGAPALIAEDNYYDLDVSTDGNYISVMLNGQRVHHFPDPGGVLGSNRAGLYVRGNTIMDFSYFYACDRIYEDETINSETETAFLDLINGGYYSGQFYHDLMYRLRDRVIRHGNRTETVKQKWEERIFDEFGEQVHEMREFQVNFQKFPVLYSSPYCSNTSQIIIDEYIPDPFRAKFVLANAARQDAMANGADSITYGSNNTVNQKLMITGRTIQQKDGFNYTVTNDQAIKARGEISLEFTSDWLQSEGAAKALGDWIVNNWSTPSDDVEINTFGNPLFEIGDLVAVNYDPQNLSADTHKYFITSIQQGWNNGPTTDIKVRRANI